MDFAVSKLEKEKELNDQQLRRSRLESMMGENKLLQREIELTVKCRQLENLESILASKDKVIAEKEQAITDKDKEITKLKKTIKESSYK